MTKTEAMSIKIDTLRMVAGSILDYADGMPRVDGDGPHHLFNKRLQRHLKKLSAHLLEGAGVVDGIVAREKSDD